MASMTRPSSRSRHSATRLRNISERLSRVPGTTKKVAGISYFRRSGAATEKHSAKPSSKLTSTAPAGSGYLKLTHPHSSDVIYRASRRPDIPRTFADDLAAAFSRALETDPRTAARLLRVFPSGQERLESLDQARQRSRGSHCQREQATECRLFDARD